MDIKFFKESYFSKRFLTSNIASLLKLLCSLWCLSETAVSLFNKKLTSNVVDLVKYFMDITTFLII